MMPGSISSQYTRRSLEEMTSVKVWVINIQGTERRSMCVKLGGESTQTYTIYPTEGLFGKVFGFSNGNSSLR